MKAGTMSLLDHQSLVGIMIGRLGELTKSLLNELVNELTKSSDTSDLVPFPERALKPSGR